MTLRYKLPVPRRPGGYDAWKTKTPYEDEEPVCICPQDCEEPDEDCKACQRDREENR